MKALYIHGIAPIICNDQLSLILQRHGGLEESRRSLAHAADDVQHQLTLRLTGFADLSTNTQVQVPDKFTWGWGWRSWAYVRKTC